MKIYSVDYKCKEDCHQGLIFVYRVNLLETPTVFRCFCERGKVFKHYAEWHPVRYRNEFKRFVAKNDFEILKKFYPDKAKELENSLSIPESVCVHFEQGDFISEAWELHKETYGREKLETWYKEWKNRKTCNPS